MMPPTGERIGQVCPQTECQAGIACSGLSTRARCQCLLGPRHSLLKRETTPPRHGDVGSDHTRQWVVTDMAEAFCINSYALLPIGYPMGRLGPVRRVPLTDVVFEDRWGQPYSDPKCSVFIAETTA
jgi:hypothetical protein